MAQHGEMVPERPLPRPAPLKRAAYEALSSAAHEITMAMSELVRNRPLHAMERIAAARQWLEGASKATEAEASR